MNLKLTLERVSWPGQTVGVRRPDRWETPLSYKEVADGVRLGVLRNKPNSEVRPVKQTPPKDSR